jgi:hypothetical protein
MPVGLDLPGLQSLLVRDSRLLIAPEHEASNAAQFK